MTGSPKSTVKVMREALTGEEDTVERAGAGRVCSSSTTYGFEAVLLLPTGSSTPPSGMETVRMPAAREDTSNVNSVSSLLAGSGSDTVPPDADTSEAVNVSALTGSPKSTVKVMLRTWVMGGSVVEITGDGRGRLISATYRSEAVLLLPARSSTPPSGMETVRLPAAREDTSNVNFVSSLLAGSGSDTVPEDADTSEAVNVARFTCSPKSTVKVMREALTGEENAVERTGAGRVRSISITYGFEAMLPLPAGSNTPPSGMETVRLPVLISDILKVNVPAVLLTSNGSDTVPPDADTSEAVNVVWFTCSPKPTMKVMLWTLVGDSSVAEIVGLGAAISTVLSGRVDAMA